jgi:hypothetical protein
MTIKLNCKVEKGLIPDEKTVYIRRADGRTEEVTVSRRSVRGDKLEASEIGRNGNQVLVELPRESASGRWRIWVAKSSIGA